MGRCCVPNCKGNYDTGPKVRLFEFPRNPERRSQWQRAVRRGDIDVAKLKNPLVCERHFKEESLCTTTKYADCDGRTIEVKMKLTRLTHDAVPTIFPDSPDYLSDAHQSREEPGSKKKRREDEQLQKAIEESMLAHKKELEENKLSCLDDINSRRHLLQEKKVLVSSERRRPCHLCAHRGNN
ncbi:THAP domain-containing protein 2-like [Rhipicephalus sanguineus]|uniref:THAP domain-containing protein 2-like n=1 Tax=Rhipicephalus sanguineus TaxID=34632 RepID=UPI001894D9D1|nr:THAP domain-containing protein 2-like [Rhipicephalus sanguineus]